MIQNFSGPFHAVSMEIYQLYFLISWESPLPCLLFILVLFSLKLESLICPSLGAVNIWSTDIQFAPALIACFVVLYIKENYLLIPPRLDTQLNLSILAVRATWTSCSKLTTSRRVVVTALSMGTINSITAFNYLSTPNIYYTRPHPSALLLGPEFSSDSIGDGPPPPHPSSLLFGAAYSSDVEGDGPSTFPTVPQWKPIHFNFKLLEFQTVTSLLERFARQTVSTYQAVHATLPGHPSNSLLTDDGHIQNLLLHCGRVDLANCLHRFEMYGIESLDPHDLRLLTNTTMDDLLIPWRRSGPLAASNGNLWYHYISFIDKLAPFGKECWFTVHMSLCWYLTTEYIIHPPTADQLAKLWKLMTFLRNQLLGRFRLHSIPCPQDRVTISLPSVQPPRVLVPRAQPPWQSMQLDSIRLVPVPDARQLIWDFCWVTFDKFFPDPAHIFSFPPEYCGGPYFVTDILFHCNRPDLHDCAHRIDITQRPKVKTDTHAVYQLANTSMDDLLTSWRQSTVRGPLLNTSWHRYLQILDSFGPYGDECWLTVHASMWWLLDSYFISPPSLSYSTGKFRRQWRLMLKMRRRLNDAILSKVRYTSYTYIPPIPPPLPTDVPPSFESVSPSVVSPLSNGTCDAPLIFPPPPHSRKRKHRKRHRRQWNRMRKRLRPPDPLSMQKLQLVQTTIPDKLVNRSFGSLNARDPPYRQHCDAVMCLSYSRKIVW